MFRSGLFVIGSVFPFVMEIDSLEFRASSSDCCD